MITLEQILLSVLVNGTVFIAVLFLKSAPPRMVLYICLVGMLAIIVPWSYIGTGVEGYILSNALIVANTPTTAPVSMPLEAIGSFMGTFIVVLWLVVGITWLVASVLRSVYTKKALRTKSLCGRVLTKYADPTFNTVLRRVRIYRLPNSSLVFASGLWRPEVWIGDNLHSANQLKAALNHELAHITANDQLTLFLIVALERLLWWNPLIWLLGRQARRQMEYASDSHCQSLVGARAYRQSLAELILEQQPRITSLELTLGNKSDIITRLEKIGMTHLIKPNHVLTTILAGSLTAFASTSLAAQSNIESPTLLECHELLPDDVQYNFSITSAIDTRKEREGELSITLIDELKPDSHAIPNGADEFLQCVQKVVGVGNDAGWPDS